MRNEFYRTGDLLEQSVVYQDVFRKGVRIGYRKGWASVLRKYLNKQLGRLTPKDKGRIESLNLGQLKQLSKAMWSFASRAELRIWLAAEGR